DPRAQTEDLGDDPVRASTYAMANLRRVLPRLVEWTSRPGEPYDDLAEIYDELISQWNRYVGHVASVVGGVYETRKAADQAGPVYEVVPEAKQREAMRFLATEVFTTPTWLLDEALLRRIEPVGAVERMRRIQVNWLDRLLDPQRLHRLAEAEVVYGDDAYTLLELLGDVRGAVWSELRGGEAIDPYRRNLQRGYLERMAFLVTHEPDAPASRRGVDLGQTDVRAFVRGQLQSLRQDVDRAARRVRDQATR